MSVHVLPDMMLPGMGFINVFAKHPILIFVALGIVIAATVLLIVLLRRKPQKKEDKQK